MRLLPKDETFWEFFTKETAAVSLASDLLLKGVREGPGSVAAAAVRIKSLERDSAAALLDLRRRLHKTFVTPIDPETFRFSSTIWIASCITWKGFLTA